MAAIKYGLAINFDTFDAVKFAKLLLKFSEIAEEKFGRTLDVTQKLLYDDICGDIYGCNVVLECRNEECIDYLREVYETARCLAKDIDLFDVREHKAPEAERRQRIRKVE